MRWQPGPFATALILILSFVPAVPAVTLEELRANPKLTPQRFASYFSAFQFEYRDRVQAPEAFLATRSGDCDDYATLAAMILSEKGYTPRLIAVRMPGLVHVVCYIPETKSYLDYNNRNCLMRTVSCGPEMQEIAKKVAKSYNAKWSSASEFTFEDGTKRLVKTITEPNARESIIASIHR